MNNKLQIFDFNKNKVRCFEFENIVYFPFQDVRSALNIERRNIPESIKNDDDYIKTFIKKEFDRVTGGVTRLNQPSILCLTEAGLYEYISISNSIYAKPFKKKINKEILPTIRKTGVYISNKLTDTQYLDIIDEISKKARQLIKENKEQHLLIDKQLLLIEKQQPIIEFHDIFINIKNLTDFRTLAKIFANDLSYDIGGNRLIWFLQSKNILMHNRTPYQKYKQYFDVKKKIIKDESDIVDVTLVNLNGCKFILKLVQKHYNEWNSNR